jgi:DNA-binding protein HU-beta/integration host factor subunit beta
MPNITKQSLVTDIVVTTGLSHKDAKKAVECLLDSILFHLERGDTIELRGFGTFSVRTRKQRPVRNPRTGERLVLEERKVPTLKFCVDIKDRIDN